MPDGAPARYLGVILRVGIYVLLVFVCLTLFAWLLAAVGGYLVTSALGVFLAALTANVFSLRIYERAPLAAIGLHWNQTSYRNLGLGLASGAGAAALVLGVPLLFGLAQLQPVPNSEANLHTAAFVLLVLALGAVGEEMLFRGYAFQVLIASVGPYATVLPAGILFGLAHSSNLGITKLGLINTAAWGVLLGVAFLRSRDLWLPIGLHLGWNWMLPLFGVHLSGFTIEVTGFTLQWKIGPLWSGGDYGPEGGLLTSAVVLLLFVFLWKAPIRRQPAHLASIAGEDKMRRWLTTVIVILALNAAAPAYAQERKLTDEERIELIRGLTAEYATAKVSLPRSRNPLSVDTKGAYDQKKWISLERENGPAARPGDLIQITKVTLEDKRIVFEINGGIRGGRRWYERVQVDVGTSTRRVPVAGPGYGVAPGGTSLALEFPHRLPPLKPAEIKNLLAPVLDFNRRSANELYVESLPPEIQQAVKDKKVIEGMDRDQVLLALGRPDNKVRTTEEGVEYEDWIYGKPPGRIIFVTFEGNEVVRVKEAYAGIGGAVAPSMPPPR